MTRMIDADKAMKRQMEKHDRVGAADFDRYEAMVVLSAMKEEPTADAVEVVRCRDCRKAEKSTVNEMIVCREFEMVMPEGFFCAAGERGGDA